VPLKNVSSILLCSAPYSRSKSSSPMKGQPTLRPAVDLRLLKGCTGRGIARSARGQTARSPRGAARRLAPPTFTKQPPDEEEVSTGTAV
jgi:hypothetical protein